MCAAEDGNKDEALKWIREAKKIVGDSAEVICREAIVHSYFDLERAEQLLSECLKKYPKHPRAHYIKGLFWSCSDNDTRAIEEYKIAISLYPTSDQYHLNEAYNNLGCALGRLGNKIEAKEAWQRALFMIPSDIYAKRNLSILNEELSLENASRS